MIQFLLPIIIIAISITGFLTFTNPIYEEINELKAQSVSYDEALNNSKALDAERDKLTAKSNTISPENINKLTKLLPQNVDNIRLILEIERLAAPFGMVLSDVQYDTEEKEASLSTGGAAVTSGRNPSPSARKDYGVWELQFSTSGTYDNFLNFVRALEKNLRIVDVASINFSSSVSSGSSNVSSTGPEIYKYDFRIKTYWLNK